jgi:hypothetical protein
VRPPREVLGFTAEQMAEEPLRTAADGRSSQLEGGKPEEGQDVDAEFSTSLRPFSQRGQARSKSIVDSGFAFV